MTADMQIGATKTSMAEFTVVVDMADIISRATGTDVSILRSELQLMNNSLGRMYISIFFKKDGSLLIKSQVFYEENFKNLI